MIVNKKGVKTFLDRVGVENRDYNFSEEFLVPMITEYDRLIAKYSASDMSWRQTSQDLLSLFNEHKGSLETELNEVRRGIRQLTDNDFLGPETRRKIRLQKLLHIESDSSEARELVNKYTDYNIQFMEMESRIVDRRRERDRKEIMEQERRERKQRLRL